MTRLSHIRGWLWFHVEDVYKFIWGLFSWLIWEPLVSLFSETPTQKALKELKNAETFEHWMAAGKTLDNIIPSHYKWKGDPSSNYYHHRLLQERIDNIDQALKNEDVFDLLKNLQTGLVRNLGHITDPKLYRQLYTGTKALIEDYVHCMTRLIETIFSTDWEELSDQERMNHVERYRKAFGKTALVLQGGSIFGLCHIGVMKALDEIGMLPRIIVGTSTGALMAAIVAVHTDNELEEFLSGRGINLDAFTQRSARGGISKPAWFIILFRRMKRYYQSGYVLDRDVLERCVTDNVGDMTFVEAFRRTDRMISIVISGDAPGTPNCLNYLTAPNVLIRTAAMASNETDPDRAPAMILAKDWKGRIGPWALNDETPEYRDRRRKQRRGPSIRQDTNTPLNRVSQLWNVNHFIISQARPYLVPFMAPALHRSNSPRTAWASWFSWRGLQAYCFRLIGKELEHRMLQMDHAFGLPRRLKRFLVDEKVPWPSVTVVPEVKWSDFTRLLRNPTQNELQHWISLGERSVWPAASALEIRCSIELALEDQFQTIRYVNPHDFLAQQAQDIPQPPEVLAAGFGGSSRRRTRARSGSADSNPV